MQHFLVLRGVHLAVDETSPKEGRVLEDRTVLEGVPRFSTGQAWLCVVKWFSRGHQVDPRVSGHVD